MADAGQIAGDKAGQSWQPIHGLPMQSNPQFHSHTCPGKGGPPGNPPKKPCPPQKGMAYAEARQSQE